MRRDDAIVANNRTRFLLMVLNTLRNCIA